MAVVERLKGRNVSGVVEVHAEVLFAPTGQITNWSRRFSLNARSKASAYAPSNKRPRWGHYGLPLKQTMRATTDSEMTRGGGYTVSAVGSTAPHALYVDQGTDGFYAKILPPTTHGGDDLFEYTYRPPGSPAWGIWKEKYVSGQEGQFFFDRALEDTLLQMTGRSITKRGGIVPIIADFTATSPFSPGNTTSASSPGFLTQLEEWRTWRDISYRRRRAEAEARRSPESRAREDAERARRREAARENRREKARERARQWRKEKGNARAKDSRAFIKAMRDKYGSSNVLTDTLKRKDGYWYVQVITDGKPMWKRGKVKTR